VIGELRDTHRPVGIDHVPEDLVTGGISERPGLDLHVNHQSEV
jgi:hypothetical protein